jgi:dolichol-phosphate mannosyltransferase
MILEFTEKTKKLSIIIPVFNEEDTLEKIISRIEKTELPMQKQLIIINDGSTDGSRRIL